MQTLNRPVVRQCNSCLDFRFLVSNFERKKVLHPKVIDHVEKKKRSLIKIEKEWIKTESWWKQLAPGGLRNNRSVSVQPAATF